MDCRLRAAYKLIETADDKHHFLSLAHHGGRSRRGAGRWSQIAASGSAADGKGKGLVAIDLLEMPGRSRASPSRSSIF